MTYSDDFRLLTVKMYYYNKNNNFAPFYKFVKQLTCSRSILYVWIEEYRKNSNCFNTNKIINYNVLKYKKITAIIEDFICKIVVKEIKFNINKLRKLISNKFNVSISRSHIYYILKKNKITYKKASIRKYPYNKIKQENAINILKQELRINRRRNIIYIDEVGVNINQIDSRGWSYTNKPCIMENKRRNIHVSIIMAINKTKIVSYKIVNGGINGEIFKEFINDDILANIKNGVLFMDNARIHHYTIFKNEMSAKNVKIIYNVPYSPQYNPIELMFNIFKFKLKQFEHNSLKELNSNIINVINNLNINGFSKYIKHSRKQLFT